MILLVEDDPLLLETMQELLDFAGYDVVCAIGPTQALQIMDTATALPQLIVSDMLMPGMDGLQFLAAVHARSWQHIPFLFVSGQEESSLRKEPLQAAIGYISKPFQGPDLLNMIERVLAT